MFFMNPTQIIYMCFFSFHHKKKKKIRDDILWRSIKSEVVRDLNRQLVFERFKIILAKRFVSSGCSLQDTSGFIQELLQFCFFHAVFFKWTNHFVMFFACVFWTAKHIINFICGPMFQHEIYSRFHLEAQICEVFFKSSNNIFLMRHVSIWKILECILAFLTYFDFVVVFFFH